MAGRDRVNDLERRIGETEDAIARLPVRPGSDISMLPESLVSLEPAANGQSIKAAFNGDPNLERKFINKTGRFIHSGANIVAYGKTILTADSSSVVALVALQDNPSVLAHFGWSSGGRRVTFTNFDFTGVFDSKTYDPMANNEFNASFHNLPAAGTILQNDLVVFGVVGGEVVGDIGDLHLTYIGALRPGSGGGGSANWCDPPTAAGTPDRILGFSGTCATPGWYLPPGSQSIMATGSCIVAPGAAPVPAETYTSIDYMAGIIVNRVSATSLQIGAGVIASELPGTTTADSTFNSDNPKNEIRYRSGIRIEDTGACTMDVFAGATATITNHTEAAAGSVDADTLYHALEFVDGLLVDDRGNGELRLGTNTPYVLIRGNPSTNHTATTGTITLNGVEALIGKMPGDATTALITVGDEPITVKTTDEVYAFYDPTLSTNPPGTAQWRYTTAFGINHRLRGMNNFDDSVQQALTHDSSGNFGWTGTVICNVSP